MAAIVTTIFGTPERLDEEAYAELERLCERAGAAEELAALRRRYGKCPERVLCGGMEE